MRVVLLVVAACVVYANSLGVPFLFDDRSDRPNLRIRELWPGPFMAERPRSS